MADTFTPEQIAQILEEFFKVVGTRQYIGARYVPIFGRKGETSIQWDNSAPYEPLTIVLYQGNSYTSRQYVPEGVDISNELFWALTGNYNSQIEQYRQTVENLRTEVSGFDGRITEVDTKIDTTSENLTELVNDKADDLTELVNEANGKFSFKTGIIPGKYIYELFTFPKATFRIDLVPTVVNAMVAGNPLTEGKTVFDYVLEHNPYFACNINPGGNLIYNNVLYGEDWTAAPNSKTGFYGTTADGNLKAGRGGSFVQFANDNNCVAAIGAWQPLIVNGVLEPVSDYSTFQVPNPYPVLGQDDDNLYLLETFSRFNGLIGMTAVELQSYIAGTLHWQNAYMLDGGGSIQAACGNPAIRLTPFFANQNYADRIQHMVIVISER